MKSSDKTCLPDMQCSQPDIPIPIKRVGVENVEVPFKLESKYGGFHQMVANVSMGTNLDENNKGISMSRLIRTLKPYLDLPLKSKLIEEIIKEMLESVGGSEAFIKFDFRLPRVRESVMSKNRFPIYYTYIIDLQVNSIAAMESGILATEKREKTPPWALGFLAKN